MEQTALEPSDPVLAVGLSVVGSQFTDTLVAAGLVAPTLMDIAPDGRIFVSEKGGALRVVKNGVLLPTPFATVSVSTSGERGLLGVALDPDHALNGYVYVYYTSPVGPRNRVTRFTASAANPDVAQSGSETELLQLPIVTATNHNAGSIRFGADGKLYIAVGDNASGSNSQSLGTTFGKILRINKDGSIPGDNPFFSSTTGINRSIYALGFRNPFAFSVQRGTGRIFVNDVGQNLYEEIDDLLAGGNYGWPASEGYKDTTGFIAPVHAYQHDIGCAITGGDFYNPPNVRFPADMVGDYFFADFCGDFIRRLDPETGTVTTFATLAQSPTALQVGPDGALYYLEYSNGALRRIDSKAAPILLEAESAGRSGPLVSTAVPGYTGSGFLDFQGAAGEWVEFTGTLYSASTIPLTLRYANGSGAAILVRVTLNGSEIVPSLSLPPTGGWSVWNQISGNISMNAGFNALRITTLGTGQPHIDHLRAY